MKPFVVLAFESTHRALDAEGILKAAGLSVVPVPTPSTLSGLCGLAMRLPVEEAQKARDLLVRASIEVRAEATIEDF